MKQTKRTTITNSIRPLRFIFGPVLLLVLLSILQNGAPSSWDTILLLVLLFLFLITYFGKKVSFDEKQLYRSFGYMETVIPFHEIKSIKRSRMKINGVRLWKVTYLNAENKEKHIRFKEGAFCSFSTRDLIEIVKKQNPALVVWEHPYFNRPEKK